MYKKFFKQDEELDQRISETHITAYLDKIKIGLLLALVFITITEVIIFFLVKKGLLRNTLCNEFISTRWTTNSSYITRYIIVLNILNWIIYGIYYLLDNFLEFKQRNLLVSVVFIIIISLYSFGHLGFIHLSLLYTIPIVFTCPLGRKYQIGTLITGIIFTIVYTIYQYTLMGTEYNFLVGLISLTSIIITYLICSCVYSSFIHALLDIEQYSKLSTKLSDEIGHDFVTGAYSKAALKNDIEKEKYYRSIAFIDLDNFKTINDTLSHATGDIVLQTLVKSAESKGERIYRYGGDEFIILSKLKEYELYGKILAIKALFTDTCKKEINYEVTFSAGITNIDPDETPEGIISKSDKVMYISKKNGKDQITVDN